ncbi:MAG: hypothetical protein VB080_01810 [Propionicimonas sp.]|uniref:AtpZ/AtpI family protein n=1 Tax=Propionicimonas sp. TaxID=1955623 RepID=UPI002B1FC5F4|nr:hypothetical protein [Propionicimonas sp.]MEA4943151.1 hypothetical protein [Propionicimonas sp.]MEA5053221.1 hypothetical protein [Propionicimonas sp.]MEA5118522.1 hypothetical protein [Propionicimonas sp.]
MSGQGNADQGLRIVSILISGVVFYGGLGWLADWWFGTSWCLPVGLIVGMVASIYLVIVQFGHSDDELTSRQEDSGE